MILVLIFMHKNNKLKVKLFSHVQLFVIPWTVAYRIPPTMGFSWQEYQSGLPFPSPGDRPNPGIEPVSSVALALQANSLPLSHLGRNQSFSHYEAITRG